MLFVQGRHDKLAEPARIAPVVSSLGSKASMLTIEHADHGFEVLVRSGRTPGDVMTELLDGLAAWIGTTVRGAR